MINVCILSFTIGTCSLNYGNPLIDCGRNMIARDHQNTFRTGIVQAKGFHSHRPEYNYVHCNEYNITFEPSSYT